MADFGAPVAAGIQPSNGIQTISSLLGLKQQQLALSQQQLDIQQRQQTLSSLTSQASQAAIHTQNLQNLQAVNWNQFSTPDGYDIQAAEQKALQVGGADGPPFVERLATMSQQGTAAKKAFFDLNQEYQAPIRAALGTWGADPNATVADLATRFDQIEGTVPKENQGAIRTIANNTLSLLTGPETLSGSPRSPQQQHAMAVAFSRAGLTESEVGGPGGLATPVPGTVSTGTQVIPTTTSRVTGVTQAANAPPVANQSMQVTLPNGQLGVLDMATGKISLAGGGKGATSTPEITAANDPNRPGANAPAQVQQQWNQALAQASKDQQLARDADQYGNNMAIAQEVRELSKATNTGPGTPEFTRLVGMITSRFGGSEGVTNTQTLESFLDRQAASMRGAMGLPATNLGAEESKIIGGNIGMQGGALRAKNDYNEALAQGLHDYRQGLDAAAGVGGNPSPTVVNRFKSEWTRYFNPLAYEYQLAKDRGDRKMQDAIVSSVSPTQAKRMRADLEATQRLAQGLPP